MEHFLLLWTLRKASKDDIPFDNQCMNKKTLTCYRCSSAATTKEHFPPRCFFPKGSGLNLQLKTVPSCTTHNNDKSGDDQFLLAHICLNASKGPGLPREIFNRSISPQLERSFNFRASIAEDAKHFTDGTAHYKVDLDRFDNFFDHLCWALYFERYELPFDDTTHSINHVYFSLHTEDSQELGVRTMLASTIDTFRKEYNDRISSYEAAKVTESVYANQVIDPIGAGGSITIIHTFYGIFEVVSMLSKKWKHLDS